MNITVRVPATSANLGPGFDCMGVALDLWNEFELCVSAATAKAVVVQTIGEGAGKLPTNKTHLVTQVFFAELVRLGHPAPPHIKLICRNAVPAGSGCGSSSTAVLAGLMLAHKYAQASSPAFNLSAEAVLNRAIAIEGHGDNVAPAFYGGLVLVSPANAGHIVQRVTIAPHKVVICVPDYHFLTSTARAALPNQFSKSDMIFNIGRSMLVLEALRTADYALLGRAMEDKLHEPYRLPLIPGAASAKCAALEQGAVAVTLSGAGPGLIAFAHNRHHEIGAAMVEAFNQANLKARHWVLDTLESGAINSL